MPNGFLTVLHRVEIIVGMVFQGFALATQSPELFDQRFFRKMIVLPLHLDFAFPLGSWTALRRRIAPLLGNRWWTLLLWPGPGLCILVPHER